MMSAILLLAATTLSAQAAEPLRVAAWTTLGAGAALDAAGFSLLVQAGQDGDLSALGAGLLGLASTTGASAFRNTAVGLTMADAERAGVDRTAGWCAVGGTVGSTVAFVSGPVALANSNEGPAGTVWWPATNLALRAGTYAALAVQLSRSARGTDADRKARLHVRPDGVSVAGRF